MGTYNEDLERVIQEWQALRPEPITIVDDELQIAFDFDAAICLQPLFTPMGLRWSMHVVSWDQTHGVDAEHAIGTTPERFLVHDLVTWLEGHYEQERKTQALIDSMPEDL